MKNLIQDIINPKDLMGLDEKSRAMVETIGGTLRLEMQATLETYRKEIEKNFNQQKRQMQIAFLWQTLTITAGAIGYLVKNFL